jgi:MoaA/NifB/PqqE/SkfB family radical SAM enzyme
MNNDAGLSSLHKSVQSPLSFLWLEITGRCNLSCVHCYAESGPSGRPDRLGTERWLSLMAEAAELGVQQIQFIGGEPTIHRDFAKFVMFASDLGFDIEVYSNLTHVNPGLWDLFQERHIRLATSFYSHDANAHDAVTQGRGSQTRTLSNIRAAIEHGLQLRVGIVEVNENQDVGATADYLRDIGVRHVGIDRSRGVGRAGTQDTAASAQELCGQCTRSRLAIDPDGWAYPCVFSRWLPAGNVRDRGLEEIASSGILDKIRADLTRVFQERAVRAQCDPEPGICDPDNGNCDPETGLCSPDECDPIAEGQCNPERSLCDPLIPCPPVIPCDPTPCAPHVPPPPVPPPVPPPCTPSLCRPDVPCRPDRL